MRERTTRQQELLDLARRLFSTHGYATTSMRDLAEAAGVLPGSLYAHFRSKSEILAAIFEDFYDDLLPVQAAAVAGDGCGLERLETMLAAVMPVIARRPRDFLVVSSEWVSLMAETDHPEAIAMAQRSLELWTAVVEDGQVDGSMRSDVSAEVLVSMTTFALVGNVICTAASPDPMPVEATTKILCSMAAALPSPMPSSAQSL